LILDRNRHVRMFLKRELERKEYLVKQVENSSELENLSLTKGHFDFIILDPELSDSGGIPIIETVLVSFPGVPIILHTLWRSKQYCSCHPSIVACIEKNANSIDVIQRLILERILKNNHCKIEPVNADFHLALQKDEEQL
jgi:DNA-binding NtrC family response regulator